MMHQFGYGWGYSQGFGYGAGIWAPWTPVFGAIFLVVLLWSFVWKGLALWHSARHHHPWWFVIILVVNTLGILEIIYLFGVLKLRFGDLFSNHLGRRL